jgi:HlyD family secretion protein
VIDEAGKCLGLLSAFKVSHYLFPSLEASGTARRVTATLSEIVTCLGGTPVAGQLSGFSVQVGQSLRRGERVGQIDSPGRNKMIAGVDEFYLGRVRLQQQASIEVGGRQFGARVTKIYPQVQNGQFEVDLQFTGNEPKDIQRGQSLQARLILGDSAKARLIPNGAFYTETGGAWVFVVAADGRSAVKRQVRLGRRNSDFIEVLEGVDPGERVITSPYTGFADKERLDLQAQ